MTIARFHFSLWLILFLLLSFLTGNAWSASYSGGILSDPSNGFQVNVPENWKRQEMNNQGTNTHLFTSPDQNVAVAVTTFPGAGNTALGQLLNTFQQTALAGSQQLAEQPTNLNGLNGMLRAYRMQDQAGPVITGAFATPGNGHGYVVWSMIPEAMYNSRSAESDAIMNTFTLISSLVKPQAVAQPTQQKRPVSAPPDGYHWFTEETSGLRWQTPKSWAVEKIGANPTLLPPSGDVLADAGGIKVQNLDRNVAKYKNLDLAVKDMTNFISGQKGTMLNWGKKTINGLNSHTAEFTVSFGEESHHMWFIHVERQNIITLIQYDAYGTVFDRQRMANAMRPHVNLCLESLRDMNMASVQTENVPATPPVLASTPQLSGSPESSRDAYLLLQNASAAKDWKTVVSLLTDNSLLNLCRDWRNMLPDADMTEADAKANPAATALEYLMYGKAHERMAWLARPGSITDVREENSSMHLVMVDHGSSGEHYYWMKKVDGRWRYDFN